MRRIAALSFALGVAATLALGVGLQNRPDKPYAVDPAPDAMARWLASTIPGERHEWLARFVGEWNTTTNLWMDPDGEPTRLRGRSTIEWMFGRGKWISETNETEPFPGREQPLESFGVTGYDNVKKQFVGVCVDSMATELRTLRGGLSPDGRTLTAFGTMDEPMTGELAKTIRYRWRLTDEDSFTLEIAEVIYGEPFTVVRVDYTRVTGGD
jgi:hypothetical protein